LIRDISDTALWAAVYRARETDRADALFRDPFARRLAGERGDKIAASMGAKNQNDWAWVTRTFLYDQYISERVAAGTDMIINLAAGLDARPYRMALPGSLQWIEVDRPALLTYKESVLSSEKPSCHLERVALDLADLPARRRLFDQLNQRAANALIITEGLLIYLTAEEVGQLARDLADRPNFRHWVLELASPGLLRMLQKAIGTQLSQAGSPLRFGPEEGPHFFEHYGWRPADVRSLLKTAARNHRVTFLMRLMSFLPESKGRQGSRPWAGVCLFEKA
jgi:methyltransferase (TIGR00027 family)